MECCVFEESVHAKQMLLLRAMADGIHPPTPLIFCGLPGTGKHAVLWEYLDYVWKRATQEPGETIRSVCEYSEHFLEHNPNSFGAATTHGAPSQYTHHLQQQQQQQQEEDASVPGIHFGIISSPVHVHFFPGMHGFLTRKIIQSVVKPMLDENSVFANVPFRIVVIDGLENLTSNDQEMLRNLIECPSTSGFSCTCQFIFLCNSSPTAAASYLQSRCTMLRFPKFTKQQTALCLQAHNTALELGLSKKQQTLLLEQAHAHSRGSDFPLVLANAIVASEFNKFQANKELASAMGTNGSRSPILVFQTLPGASTTSGIFSSSSSIQPPSSLSSCPFQLPAQDLHVDELVFHFLLEDYTLRTSNGADLYAKFKDMQKKIHLLLKHFSCREGGLAALIIRKLCTSSILSSKQRTSFLPVLVKFTRQLCLRGIDFQHCFESFCFWIAYLYSSLENTAESCPRDDYSFP